MYEYKKKVGTLRGKPMIRMMGNVLTALGWDTGHKIITKITDKEITIKKL